MKYLNLFIFVCLIGFAQAQELPKGLAPNEREKGFLESIGVMDNPYLNKRANATIFTTPPNVSVRTMAEWEEIEALTITWSTSYGITEEVILGQIVEHAVSECDVVIICDDQNSVANYLTGIGVSTANVSFIETNFDNIWMRDYGQNTVYKNDVEERILVDWIYNRNRPNDDLVPEYIADFLDIDMYNTTEPPYDLMATGGNFMSDGMGTAFSSKLIEDENSGGYAWNGPAGDVFYPNHSLTDIENILQQFMGIDNYIIMETLPYDGIHHIDMHMKLLDEETILMAEYPNGVADGPQIEANLLYVLNNYNSAFGTDYKVVRIPSPPSSGGYYPDNNGYYRTYTNSVFVNNTVLVPFYREEYDTIAQRIYENALPGYTIVGIDVDDNGTNLISYSGAIHCITHSVGVDEPLLIQHQSLQDTTVLSNYTVSANIQHTSGISSANVYFTTDLNAGYSSPIAMNNTSGTTWEGNIPGTIQSGSTVYYYIEATANNGKMVNRPLPAPDGYFDFKVSGNSSTQIFNLSAINLDVFPNPASAITCIPISVEQTTFAKVTLVDVLGRENEVIFKGLLNAGQSNYFFDANQYAPGVYTVLIETSAGKVSRSVMIR